MAPLLIGSRRGADLAEKIDQLPTSESIKRALREGLKRTSLLDIEANKLRQLLRENKKEELSQFIPLKVLDYIYENQLYFTN